MMINTADVKSNKIDDKLITVIGEAYKRPFYRNLWGMSYEEVCKLIRQDKFHLLPVIRKKDISKHWKELIEYGDFGDMVSSSGTTGRPVDIPMHRAHEEIFTECLAQVFCELGLVANDKVLHLLSLNDLCTLGPY